MKWKDCLVSVWICRWKLKIKMFPLPSGDVTNGLHHSPVRHKSFPFRQDRLTGLGRATTMLASVCHAVSSLDAWLGDSRMDLPAIFAQGSLKSTRLQPAEMVRWGMKLPSSGFLRGNKDPVNALGAVPVWCWHILVLFWSSGYPGFVQHLTCHVNESSLGLWVWVWDE